MALRAAAICFLLYLSAVQCQENAGTGVASRLIPCYNTSAIPDITSPYRRPPATVNVLVEYIRKLEDANPNMSPQQLSLQLLQRFRQDGIKRAYNSPDPNNRYSIPYSPINLEVYKNRVLLLKLIPRVEQNLELGDLSLLEMCSLHYMISSSVDKHLRGDESNVCPKTSRYTSRIIKREVEPLGRDFGVESLSGQSNVSSCPLEGGVVFTNYGTVKAGNMLAGIATGLNQQKYLGYIDNRFASTIAGELTEASLYQSSETIQIGAQGGWNSTINPRYYFLQKNTLLQVTDAEIRGGLDGLFMGLNMATWKSSFPDLKISQIIDMYYSPYQRGVFDSDFKACNRNILYNELTTSDKLKSEIYNFMPVLNEQATFMYTKTNESFTVYSKAAVEAFNNYLPQMSTNDPICQPDDSAIQRTAADVSIFVDFGWSHDVIQPILSFVLDNIDVNKFGSKYTIYRGSDALNITNTTSYLSDFYELFNKSLHDTTQEGFDYVQILKITEDLVKAKLNNNTYTGGDSTIILLAPKNPPSESDKSFIEQRRKIFAQYLPDLKFIVLANNGNADDYSSIVTNPSKDVTIHSSSGDSEDPLKQTGLAIVRNIRSIPRSLVNPACGSGFSASNSNTQFTVTDYVEPNGVNYYRISPNYFYSGDAEHRYLKVRELSYGNIYFCYSKDQEQPTNQTGECYTLKSNEQSIDIKGVCGDSWSGCSPIYISISANSSNVKCTDTLCRFPDNIKYTISMERVGCASGSSMLTSGFIATLVLLAMGLMSGKFCSVV